VISSGGWGTGDHVNLLIIIDWRPENRWF